MHKPILFGLAMLAVGGCASVGETLASPPKWTFETAKTPREFRDCYVRSSDFGVSITESGPGYLYVAPGGYGAIPGSMWEVQPKGEGAEIRVWGHRGDRNAVQRCV